MCWRHIWIRGLRRLHQSRMLIIPTGMKKPLSNLESKKSGSASTPSSTLFSGTWTYRVLLCLRRPTMSKLRRFNSKLNSLSSNLLPAPLTPPPTVNRPKRSTAWSSPSRTWSSSNKPAKRINKKSIYSYRKGWMTALNLLRKRAWLTFQRCLSSIACIQGLCSQLRMLFLRFTS